VTFKIIMTTSVTRSCFIKQHQGCKSKTKTSVCKTKTKTDFVLVSDRSCTKTDGLRPHQWKLHIHISLIAAAANYYNELPPASCRL